MIYNGVKKPHNICCCSYEISAHYNYCMDNFNYTIIQSQDFRPCTFSQARMSRLLLVVVVLAASAVSLSSANAQHPATGSGTNNEEAHENVDAKALFASYSTLTRTGVSFTTSTVWATCISGTDVAKVCGGRKRRTVSRAEVLEPDVRYRSNCQIIFLH